MAGIEAFEDWVEAEAIVAALRRSARAAAARAAERAHDAAMLLRCGRQDAFAAGVADSARLLAQRAADEERRLAEALRREEALRARVAASGFTGWRRSGRVAPTEGGPEREGGSCA